MGDMLYMPSGTGFPIRVHGAFVSDDEVHRVVEYLKAPPDRATLERLVAAVDSPPADLVRKDKRFKELGLDADAYTTPDAVVALLVEHPELLQRPILVRGDRTVIGRPPERVLELVD